MGSHRSQLALIAGVLALVWIGPAFADATPPPVPPPGTPSISQYVETVPTSTGGSSPGAAKRHISPLPQRIASNLRRQDDQIAKRLETVATSSDYGAPQRSLPTTPGYAQTHANALSAAVSAVSDSGDSHLLWLLAAVLVVTTTMVWSTTQRRGS
jgi:hypothetical protein